MGVLRTINTAETKAALKPIVTQHEFCQDLTDQPPSPQWQCSPFLNAKIEQKHKCKVDLGSLLLNINNLFVTPHLSAALLPLCEHWWEHCLLKVTPRERFRRQQWVLLWDFYVWCEWVCVQRQRGCAASTNNRTRCIRTAIIIKKHADMHE